MRAVIYAAKSTEDKRGSIGTQLEECRERAGAEGWEVVGEFTDEAFSAYHGNRGDGLARAMALCEEAGGDVALIVQHSDRLARGNVKDARHLVEYAIWAIKHDVRLVSLQDPEMLAEGDYGLLMSTIGGMRNHQDSKRKAESVKAGIKRRRAKGKAWGKAPQGYKVEPRFGDDGEVVRDPVVDPEAAPIIEMLFAELDAGASTGDVARKLNRASHLTQGGYDFTARRVRFMAENRDYMGVGPYPEIIDPELWERVNDKIRRADPAAVQNAKGGRRPTADFMLRRLAFCAECGQPVYAIVRHGVRLYCCRAQVRNTGTCSSLAIPADIVEEHVLDHLSLFLADDLETWIRDRIAERSDEQRSLQGALDTKRQELADLDALREERMAEITEHGITSPVAFELIERIDRQREVLQREIDDADAVLSEWTGQLSVDGVLDFYDRLVDLVKGRVAKADGIAEINAALHDSLLGVWLTYDGETLTADIEVRPSGWPEGDAAMADLFRATLPSYQESIDTLRRALPDEFPDDGTHSVIEPSDPGGGPADGQLSDRESKCRSSTGANARAGAGSAAARSPRAATRQHAHGGAGAGLRAGGPRLRRRCDAAQGERRWPTTRARAWVRRPRRTTGRPGASRARTPTIQGSSSPRRPFRPGGGDRSSRA